VKAAAVSRLLRQEHEEVLVHTGQHYDDELSTVFVQELGIPAPEHELAIGSGSNTQQTARMLEALAPLLAQERPDAVLVYGDTNSTLAGALAAAQAGIGLAHVEAGMRSFDRLMPEELNRVVADHLSMLLLCSSQGAVDNLAREGIVDGVEMVGDVMVDVAQLFAPRARQRTDVLERWNLREGGFLLATAHRAGNVDVPERLAALVDLLRGMPLPVLLPLHPRTARRLREAGTLEALTEGDRVLVTTLLMHARAVLTDSGGVQKEAYLAGVPCVTMRDRTEWPETIQTGWNTLVDLDAGAAREAIERPLPDERPELYGDGRAGDRVVAELVRRFSQ
jgi:UDP-GlcNAc3NAcA epimerase